MSLMGLKDTVKINNYKQKRIEGAGRTVTIKSRPIEVDLDPDKLAEPVAEAMRDEIQGGIEGITERAKRQKGRRRPNLFYNTGKLVNGLKVERRDDGEYAIVAPPDRLQNADTLKRLRELVKVLRHPRELLKKRAVVKAHAKAAERMHKLGR